MNTLKALSFCGKMVGKITKIFSHVDKTNKQKTELEEINANDKQDQYDLKPFICLKQMRKEYNRSSLYS